MIPPEPRRVGDFKVFGRTTAADLRSMVRERQMQEKADRRAFEVETRQTARLAALADAVTEHGVATVGDLPAAVRERVGA